MTNALFMYNNLVDSATLTASTEATGFPVENIQSPLVAKVWKSAGSPAGTANVVFDLGTAQAINCVAIAGYTWTVAPTTLNLEFNNADVWGAPAVVEALTWSANPTANGNKGIITKIFTTLTYRYVRLNIVYAGSDWDIGRIFLGTYFEPTYNYNYFDGHDVEFVDPSIINETIGGQEYVDELDMYRKIAFECKAITQTQFEAFQTMINMVGIRKPLFIAFDYDNEPNEMTLYGKFTSLPKSKKIFTHTLPFTFTEDV